MRTYVITAIAVLGLPFMGLAQTTDQQQQTDTQTTAPAKGKKMRGAQEPSKAQAKPETAPNVRGQSTVKGRAQEINRNQAATRSTTGHTNVSGTNQTVNKQEFMSRHSEVFSLGRHPKEFFIQRYGSDHFRLIGNTYFVFLDGCWVSVDVDGFTYTKRVICQGDPDFVEVE